ncbi:MAG: helix-turn-helix domain-containing protein [Alphaproteobacteria bacterium]|nr:helix-turn-helix domain-containing protein [Alphaproteobacteria bacterium]
MKHTHSDVLDKPTCTVEEFRKLMGLSKNPAYDAIKRGDIPSIRLGGRIVVPTAPLRRLLGLPETPKG